MRTKWTDDEGDTLVSSRMARLDLLIIALSWTEALFGQTATAIGGIRSLVQSHYNYTVDRDEFHESAVLEIETLTEGDGND